MADAFIYDHVRTPRGRGKPDGALHGVTPIQLAAQTLQAVRDRNQLNTALLDDVVLGPGDDDAASAPGLGVDCSHVTVVLGDHHRDADIEADLVARLYPVRRKVRLLSRTAEIVFHCVILEREHVISTLRIPSRTLLFAGYLGAAIEVESTRSF